MKTLLLFCGSAALLLGSATMVGSAPSGGPQRPAPADPTLAYDLDGLPWPASLTAPPAAPEPPPPPPRPDRGVHLLVSLPEQKAWVFDDGELVATSPVSTGKRGHSTPAGTFPILQKKVHHRSNKYSNAPMPYMQRLTWGGIALHAGPLPGYPASHGCIRLPRAFAKKLYGMTNYRTTVTVTRERPESGNEALTLLLT
jgi:hypothetical protein